MINNQSMYYRYFVYSAEEEALKEKVHGRNAKFGTVIVRGVPKRYTSILTDLKDSRPDAIVVTKGDIRKIKTKKGEDMCFINGSDETDSGDFVLFPKNYKEIIDINNKDLVRIKGQVTRRNDKYQIVVSKIEKI